MEIERIVFIYMYVCACVMLFDFLFLGYTKYSIAAIPQKAAKLKKMLERQCELIEKKGCPGSKLQKIIYKKLCSISYLNAYSKLLEQNKPLTSLWAQNSGDVFLFLAQHYSRSASEKKAFFSYILSRSELKMPNGRINRSSVDVIAIADLLVSFIRDPSVYVRENSFKAILNFGDYKNVISAIYILNEKLSRQNEKLISDNLLAFKGDHKLLSAGLWKEFDSMSSILKVSFINYMRMVQSKAIPHQEYFHDFHSLLVSRNTDKEVRLALIRYFKSYPYPPVYELLLEFMASPNELMWSYAAVSATALSAYPQERTCAALLQAVTSRNWYLRFNAAESLISLCIDYEKILGGSNDVFAKEMVAYRMQVNKQKAKGRAGA